MERHPDGSSFFIVFATRDVKSGVYRENPVLAINQAKTPLAKEGRGFILNLRVDNLEATIKSLVGKGLEVDETRLEWERGKHA